ncbi:MAG: flagellar biosynthesis protein FlhF [Spirochaetes bacterium RBG_13_68_11]|nr:MAG: flagellar biosynthesis protein FlhF [Spirochaetes bacterium RBG_13_68_11]
MQYFTVQARSDREALEKMKASYGDEARILTHRSVRLGGVRGLFGLEGVELTGYLSEDGARRRKPPDAEEEKKKILETVRREQTLQVLLKEIQGLRESLQARGGSSDGERTHPTVGRIDELLRANEFTEEFAAGIRERIRTTFPLGELESFGRVQNAVVEWIGERIAIDPPPAFVRGKPTVVVLVGPTGVGKTTTVAKLAAVYGIGSARSPARRVRIVTIDNYRIAAKQQIETYAEIMRIPVTLVESTADLEKAMALAQDTDLVLVDTIGRSPRDLDKLAEMKQILDAIPAPSRCTYLALSATTKASDVEEVLRQYEPFGYRAVVLTKLDETLRIGAVVSSLARRAKPVAWLCDGQGVPQDIAEATVPRLLMNMEGFRIDRGAVEARHGARGKAE